VKVGTITNILLERETTLHIGFVSLLKNEVISTSWFITNLPSLAAQTFNVNLTQKKVCYLYFYNNSGGTSFTWATGTANSLKWPSGAALNPSNGSRDLYSIVLMGCEILINRIAASYS